MEDFIRKLLVAFDGSPYSRHALDYACRLAMLFNASVRVVLVVDLARIRGIVFDILITREEELKAEARKLVEKAIKEQAEKYPAVKLEYVIRVGHPLEEIIKEAKSWKPDILVLGARGTSDIKEIRLGSIAEALVRTSDIPLLIVK